MMSMCIISRGSGQKSDRGSGQKSDFCKIWSRTMHSINTSNGIARSKCDLALRSRYNRPTASARSVTNGPPTGAENGRETVDPGFSTRTNLVHIRSFRRERLPSVAAKDPSCEY